MTEFTGERVVPGHVPEDLWNEHLSRYAFAARLAHRKRVLDIGCGTGYGAALIAAAAASVSAVDISAEVVAAAQQQYPEIDFQQASATALPFPEEHFDLITAFEVIEHLEDWPALLSEARRVLSPNGQLVVSTPNKLYYAATREKTGPNPFHAHEFEFEEFREALEKHFPSVSYYLQNHIQGIAFQPLRATPGPAHVHVERTQSDPSQSHFFLAVCALRAQTGAPTWVYLPATTNLLRERELHIAKLESELAQKDEWLVAAQSELAELVERFRRQNEELLQRTEWVENLKTDLGTANQRVADLQEELASHQERAQEVVSGYENKLAELHASLATLAAAQEQWQKQLEAVAADRDARNVELQKCIDLLHVAEQTVEERTAWAQRLDQDLAECRAQIESIRDSRWLRLGRRFGVGPIVGGS